MSYEKYEDLRFGWDTHSKYGKQKQEQNLTNNKGTDMKNLNHNEFRELITTHFKKQGKNCWFDFLTFKDNHKQIYYVPCIVNLDKFDMKFYFKLFCNDHYIPAEWTNKPMDYVNSNVAKGIKILTDAELEKMTNTCGHQNITFKNITRDVEHNGETIYDVTLKKVEEKVL